MDPIDRLRLAGKRMSDPLEALAQRVAEHVVELAVNALDVNALMQRVDLNAMLDQVDIDHAVLQKVDVNALLGRVDVNALLDNVDMNALLDNVDMNALLEHVDMNEIVSRIDLDGLVKQTDLGAIIARSSGGLATEALDAARSGAVGLDRFVDRWVMRLLRRKEPGPAGPSALLGAGASS